MNINLVRFLVLNWHNSISKCLCLVMLEIYMRRFKDLQVAGFGEIRSTTLYKGILTSSLLQGQAHTHTSSCVSLHDHLQFILTLTHTSKICPCIRNQFDKHWILHALGLCLGNSICVCINVYLFRICVFELEHDLL